MKKTRNVASIILISGMIICFIIICVKLWQGFHLPGDDKDNHFIGKYHNMGDAIGGITAPLVGILSSILVFLSFQQQIRANEIIMEIRHEDNLFANLKEYLERLETKFGNVNRKIISEGTQGGILGMINLAKDALITIKKMKHNYENPDYIENRNTIELIIEKNLTEINDIQNSLQDTRGILAFCDFYQSFIIENWRTLNASKYDSIKLFSLYTSEIVTFVGVNLKKTCDVAETMQLNLENDNPKHWVLKQIGTFASNIINNQTQLESIVGYEYRNFNMDNDYDSDYEPVV